MLFDLSVKQEGDDDKAEINTLLALNFQEN